MAAVIAPWKDSVIAFAVSQLKEFQSRDVYRELLELTIIFIHSFINIDHLYSAFSRELLRGAPDSSTAKKSSLKVGKNRR